MPIATSSAAAGVRTSPPRWYADHGYAVVARNWRCPSGEIDLVARRGRLVVVVEVKARRTDAFGPAAAAVGPRQAAAAAAPRRRVAGDQRASRGVEVRFDVVAITGSEIDVIAGAF